MKNQYVGDVNDFVKYGLIRALTANGEKSSLIAWLLTPNDFGLDGRNLAYLNNPSAWRSLDQDLFDALNHVVTDGTRSVDAIASSGILRGAEFYADVVPTDPTERHHHFERLLKLARGRDLVFFDPDNGLEVKGCPVGKRGSEKYLLWCELVDTFHAGHSVLVYQHFPRQPREEFIERMSQRIADTTGASEVIAVRTNHVVFFLVPQDVAKEYYAGRIDAVAMSWRHQITSARFQTAPIQNILFR